MEIKKARLSEEIIVEFLDVKTAIFRNAYDDELTRIKDRPAILLYYLILNRNQYVQIGDNLFDFIWGENNWDENKIPQLRAEISKYKRELINSLNSVLECDITKKNTSFVTFFSEKGNGYKVEIKSKYIESIGKQEYTFNEQRNIVPCPNYINRPEIMLNLEGAFESTTNNRFVFLSGVGGIGKSELARNFARESKGSMFRVGIELEYCETSNSFEDAITGCDVQVIAGYSSISEDKRQEAKRNLLMSADESILILIHNFDKFDIEFLEHLESDTGNARILITTRLGTNSGIEDYGPVVSFDSFQDSQMDFAIDIFRKYADKSCPTDNIVKEIVNYVGGHTMMTAILGCQVRKYGFHNNFLKDLKDSVREALKLGGKVLITKDKKVFEKADPYSILKNLFRDVLRREFTDRERQVLGAILLLPEEFRDINIVATLVGDLDTDRSCVEAREAIVELLECGYIQENNSNNELKLSVHPLIAELVSDPTVKTDSKNGTIAELSSDFLCHILRNFYVSDFSSSIETFRGSFRNQYLREIGDISPTEAIFRYLCGDFDYRFFPQIVSGVFENHQGYYSKDIINNALSHIFDLHSDAVTTFSITKNAEHLLAAIEFPLNKHQHMAYTTSGKYGNCYFLHDYEIGISLCILNCSEQKLPKNRYYSYNCEAAFQTGKQQTAILEYYSPGKPLLFVPSPSLLEIAIPDSIEYKYNHNNLGDTQYIPIEVIGEFAFYSEDTVQKIILGRGIKHIYPEAFANMPNLGSIVFQNHIEQIDVGAFSQCPKLKTVKLPVGVRLQTAIFDALGNVYHYKDFVLGIDIDTDADKHLKISGLYYYDTRAKASGFNEEEKYKRFLEINEFFPFEFPFDHFCEITIDYPSDDDFEMITFAPLTFFDE